MEQTSPVNNLLVTRLGKYRREPARVSRIKPYYDRKTILLESYHESETSHSSEEDFPTISRTLTFEPKNATSVKVDTPAKSIIHARWDTQPTPRIIDKPTVTRTVTNTPQEAPQIPEATLHTQAQNLEHAAEI